MGIILNRRRVMGGEKEDTYIQDGLVFWLDGTQDIVKNRWTDLIGGVAFASNDFVKEAYGWSIRFGGAKTASDLSFPYDSCTLEVVCKVPSWSYGQQVFYCGKSNMISFQFYLGQVLCKTEIGKTYQYPLDSRRHSFSNSNDGFYIDASPIINSGTDSIGIGGNGTSIGAKYLGTEVYKLEIDCIRIYNRILSAAEILHNARVDNARFNLGLTI